MVKGVKKAPLIAIGIGGASACGKTLLLKSITSYLNEKNVTHFDLDGYHLHAREEREKLNEYPDEIKANDFDKIIRDLTSLMSGKSVDMPIYDHKRGIFSPPVKLTPKPIVFVEGLHAAMINDISNQNIIDFSVFLYPHEDLRKSWKVKRDVNERGYSYSEATGQIAKREPLVVKYIFPQINTTDVLILIERTENSFTRHSVLLSPKFLNRLLTDKTIEELLLKCFSVRDVNFNNKQFTEIHLKSNNTVLDFLIDKISRLGLVTPQRTVSHINDHYSFDEVVEIVFILIIVIMAERQ